MNRKIPFRDYILFAEAWCLLALARFVLVFVPFRKIVPWLGRISTLDDTITESAPLPTVLENIRLSILRASNRSPWRTKCFEQALAAKMMLKRRKYISTITFGVHKSIEPSGRITAHAWLECNGYIVTGGGNIRIYSVISSFRS